MPSTPLVSVIIPNYNRSLLVAETINSVLAQTYTTWEAIIVDDGSSDQSIEVIESYVKKDNRVKLYTRDRKPKGAPTCRNIGFERSNGRYIIFLDSDDLLAPDCLQNRVVCFNQNPHLDFIVFQMLIFYEKVGDSSILGNIGTDESDINRFLRGDVVWGVFQPIWKKTTLMKLNGFDESLKCWQEYDLHLRALIQNFKYIKKFDNGPDCYCRHHRFESIGKEGKKDVSYIDSQEMVLVKALDSLPKPLAKSIKQNVRVQLINVCFNYANLGYQEKAVRLFSLGEDYNLFSSMQTYKLLLILSMYKYSFHKVKGFYRLRSFLTKDITLANYHLKIRYQPSVVDERAS